MSRRKNEYYFQEAGFPGEEDLCLIRCYPLDSNSRPKVIRVDYEDLEMLKQYQWHVEHSRANIWYAAASVNGKTIRMHRLLVPGFQSVDHINHDGLDNRKSNLRGCTNAENNRNKRTNFNPKSGAVGVRKVRDRYFARIMVNKKEMSLGGYPTLEEAISARKEAELKYFGEFRITSR